MQDETKFVPDGCVKLIFHEKSGKLLPHMPNGEIIPNVVKGSMSLIFDPLGAKIDLAEINLKIYIDTRDIDFSKLLNQFPGTVTLNEL